MQIRISSGTLTPEQVAAAHELAKSYPNNLFERVDIEFNEDGSPFVARSFSHYHRRAYRDTINGGGTGHGDISYSDADSGL